MSRSPEVPYTVYLKFPFYFEIPLPVVPFWMDTFCEFNKDLVIAYVFLQFKQIILRKILCSYDKHSLLAFQCLDPKMRGSFALIGTTGQKNK